MTTFDLAERSLECWLCEIVFVYRIGLLVQCISLTGCFVVVIQYLLHLLFSSHIWNTVVGEAKMLSPPTPPIFVSSPFPFEHVCAVFFLCLQILVPLQIFLYCSVTRFLPSPAQTMLCGPRSSCQLEVHHRDPSTFPLPTATHLSTHLLTRTHPHVHDALWCFQPPAYTQSKNRHFVSTRRRWRCHQFERRKWRWTLSWWRYSQWSAEWIWLCIFLWLCCCTGHKKLSYPTVVWVANWPVAMDFCAHASILVALTSPPTRGLPPLPLIHPTQIPLSSHHHPPSSPTHLLHLMRVGWGWEAYYALIPHSSLWSLLLHHSSIPHLRPPLTPHPPSSPLSSPSHPPLHPPPSHTHSPHIPAPYRPISPSPCPISPHPPIRPRPHHSNYPIIPPPPKKSKSYCIDMIWKNQWLKRKEGRNKQEKWKEKIRGLEMENGKKKRGTRGAKRWMGRQDDSNGCAKWQQRQNHSYLLEVASHRFSSPVVLSFSLDNSSQQQNLIAYP